MAILSTNIVCWMKSMVDYVAQRNGEQVATPEVQQLGPGDVMRHTAVRQTIVVVAGTAWITVGGNDYVVRVGESLNLPCDPYPALISSLNGRRVIYRLV